MSKVDRILSFCLGVLAGALIVGLASSYSTAKPQPAEKPDIRAYADTARGVVCYSTWGTDNLSCVKERP